MKILVTGGAGFVGSHTVDLLVPRGHEVTVLDSLDPQVHGEAHGHPRHLAPHLDTGAIRFVQGDVRDRALVTSLVTEVDAILHLAAAVGVGQSMYQPHHYTDVNIGGTALLMDILANTRHRVGKIVVASSMSLYGEGPCRCAACGPFLPAARSTDALSKQDFEHHCPRCGQTAAPLPTDEEKPPFSTSVYAITKQAQEEMLLLFGRTYRIPVVALRYFNIYGPRQSLNNPYTGVAAIFLSQLRGGKAPLVFEDGLQSRDFVHVRDVARANALALESAEAGQLLYNVGSGTATTVLEVAQLLAASLGVEIAPEVSMKFRAGDIRHCLADASRIAAGLRFRAEISREEGFRDLIAWSQGEVATPAGAPTGEHALRELKARNLVA